LRGEQLLFPRDCGIIYAKEMLRSIEDALQRWIGAGLLDAGTAERIRQFEAGREQPSGWRWQVLLALIFGAILLAAGFALFIAAHWERLSPIARFVIVLLTFIAIHLIAISVRQRFDRLAIVLHGVGSLAAGAAIPLVGQIFNVQEHWPTGVLLWALCAMAGWVLLGDQVQQTITLLLLPAWIVCEWWACTVGYRGAEQFAMRLIAVIGAVYLTAFLRSQKELVVDTLFGAGAIALAAAIVASMALLDWANSYLVPAMPVVWTIFGWCLLLAVLLLAWFVKHDAVVPATVVLATAILLPRCFRERPYNGATGTYYSREITFFAYLLIAAVACFLAWWGVHERSRALINYGVVAFAATVLWFYFSSIMDKLDRSLSLILLGLLFLGGGWALEKLRRRMMRQVNEAA
jgi:uncharacterized membrane protein